MARIVQPVVVQRPLSASPARSPAAAPNRGRRTDRAERRPRPRPPLEPIRCAGCGDELATARPGTPAFCRRCRRWSGSIADRANAGGRP